MMLLPLLQKTQDSRLVLQSSDLHRGISTVHFRDIAELNTDIGAMKLYSRTKLGQILMVRALHRRKQKGQLGLTPGAAPYILATHPGAVKTDQQDQAVEAYGTMGKLGVKAVQPFMKDPVDGGCRSALFAATIPAVIEEGIDGEYIVPDRKVSEVSKEGRDEELGENLWRLTETVLKEKLGKLEYEMS